MHGYMEEAEISAAELHAIYLKASKDITKKARKIFDKYKQKYGLSRKEAEMLLKQVKDPADIKSLLRLLEKDPDNSELAKELESQAYSARLRHLSSLNTQIDSVVLSLCAEQNRRITACLSKLAKQVYYKTIFDIQQYAGYGTSFRTLDKDKIKDVLNTPWAGGNYSQNIWKNTEKLAKRLKRELVKNLLTGGTIKEAADAIEHAFSVGSNDAKRLVRTESAYVCNQLQLESYKECGIKKYIYVAILDLRTSAVCRSLDKKRFSISDAKPGTNYPPMHPWCRSTTIADMPDSWLRQMKQSAIDPATGQRITVPGDMTYSEWYEKYVEGNPQAEAKELRESSENGGLKANISGKDNRTPDPLKVGTLKDLSEENIRKTLYAWEKKIESQEFESAIVITKAGDIYKIDGDANSVNINGLSSEQLSGAWMTHNHPASETYYSFSAFDISEALRNRFSLLRGTDMAYNYEYRTIGKTMPGEFDKIFNLFGETYRNKAYEAALNGEINIDVDEYDFICKMLAKDYKFYYERKKK